MARKNKQGNDSNHQVSYLVKEYETLPLQRHQLQQQLDTCNEGIKVMLKIDKELSKAIETSKKGVTKVLEPKDRWFRGRDEDGPVRIQIPQQFWKIVVSKGPSGPEAYGFVLEQDVRRITEEEFAVSRNWVKALKRISDIEKLLRGWVDLTSLKMIDQFNRVGG